MMSSHDNPPRRGTRSWSTPDPVMSRGRRYSHHSRRKKNEKDGGFNKKSQSFSPRKKRDERDERDERKRKERKIGTIQLHSLITRERIILSCHRAYKIVKKKKNSSPGSGSSPLGRTPPSSFFWSVVVVVVLR